MRDIRDLAGKASAPRRSLRVQLSNQFVHTMTNQTEKLDHFGTRDIGVAQTLQRFIEAGGEIRESVAQLSGSVRVRILDNSGHILALIDIPWDHGASRHIKELEWGIKS